MRRNHHIFHEDQRMIGRDRFGIGHVQTGGPDRAIAERIGQGIGIDHWTTGGIDEHRGRFHLRQFVASDQLVCFRRERAVEGHKIGTLQELIERGIGHPHLGGECLVLILVVGKDLHVEPAGPLGDFLADASQPDDAEGCMVDIPAKQEGWSPRFPVSGPNIVGRFHDAASSRHQQCPGHVGRCFSEHARRVAYQHAMGGGRIDIDVVVANGEVADHVELWLGIQHSAVDPVGNQRHCPGCASQQAGQFSCVGW